MKSLILKEKTIDYRKRGYSYGIISEKNGTLQLQIKSCGKKKFGRSLHRRIMGWIEAVIIK